jgi:uncharacterized protein (TIRG00374 family)
MTGPRKKSARGTVTNAILIALALGLLGHVISKNQDLIGEVFRHKLDLQLLVLAFLCYFVAKLLTFVRWYWLVRAIEPSFRFDVAIVLGFIGNLFNLLIPGAIGGDLIKAAYLAKMDVNKTRAIASMVIDRLIGLLGLFIVAGVAGTLAWSYASVDVRRLILVVWFAVGLSVPALILIFSQSLSQICTSLAPSHGRVATIIGDLERMSSIYRQRPGAVAASFAISLLIQATFTFSFYLVGKTLFPGQLPSLGQHLLIVPLIFFTIAVPLPFGAIGLGEEVSEQLFLLVAHPGGALALMGFRMLMYAGALISAVLYLINIRQIGDWTASSRVSIDPRPKNNTTIAQSKPI